MKSLKKQFPYSEGWIHAKLTLYRDHGLTVEELTRNMNPKGNLEMGHVEITGNRAIVISREIKKATSADLADKPRLTIEVTDLVKTLGEEALLQSDSYADVFDGLNPGAEMLVKIHPLDFALLKSVGSRLLSRATFLKGTAH